MRALRRRSNPRRRKSASACSASTRRYKGIPVALAAPARLKVVGQRVTIEPATLRLGGGRLAVSGVVDPAASDLTLDITGLPLALVDAFAPGTGLEGTLQTKARVTGALANPRVQATYAANGLRIKRPETALLPALAVQGTADWPIGRLRSMRACRPAAPPASAIKGKAALAQGTAHRADRRHGRPRAVLAGARPHACATSPAPCAPT